MICEMVVACRQTVIFRREAPELIQQTLLRLSFSLRQYRMIKVVSRRVNLAGSFAADPSGADANFAGLLEVNQEICIRWLAENPPPDVPPYHAVLP